jgi:hypothetical protein
MLRATFALIALLAAPAPALATIINLTASLDGLQEVPVVVTTGTGSAVLTFDDVSKLLSWNISFSGLIGTTTNAHFHGPAAAGVSAGVRLGLSVPLGVTFGNIVGSATLSAPNEAELLAGLWYINIHSTFKGGGEIRGQVLTVPEPAAALLLGFGLVGLALRRAVR